MDLVFNILLVLHLIGWAIVLGGTLVSLRATRIAPGVLHGILTALVTGIAMVGILSAGLVGDDDPNTAKFAVKLLVALAVTVLIVRGVRKPEVVNPRYQGVIAGLTVVNICVAVLW